jgi:hypothetical protein
MSWHDFLHSRFSIIMPIIYVDHKPLLAFIYVLNIQKADLLLAFFSYHLSMNNEHDTRQLLDWIRQNTHYFFNDHFTLIEKFRTCVEQTCFSKHYSFWDLKIIWQDLKQKYENMRMEYVEQLMDEDENVDEKMKMSISLFCNVINYR